MQANAGGQYNEVGSEYRARLGALLATAVLLADDLCHLGAPVDGTPVSIRAEADGAVDDLVLRLAGGSSVYVQAKHRVSLSVRKDSPFGKAMSQFVQAHRDSPSDQPLVLAYAHGSAPLAAFGRWCESLRYAEKGVLSRAESQAAHRFARLVREFGVIDPGEATALANRIHLWQAEPRHGDLYAVGIQRLTQAGVIAGHQSDAFDLLTKRVRLLARRRAGDDLDHLVEILRRGGHLDLQQAQATSVRAVLLVARHRERLVEQGRRLSAFGVPAAVANIKFSHGDAKVHVQLPRRDDENVPRETSLEQALRRRGRIVVLGDGGSGKSTALRVLAARLAADAWGPVPLKAHWRDLQQQSDDPLRALIDEATRDLMPSDAELFEGSLRRAFLRGECTLLLDGLDEVVTGREKLAALVKLWLDGVPASTEVVVAARPNAAEALIAFDWPRLQLASPRDPEATAHAVVSAIANEDGRSDAWIDERLRWVHERWRRDRELASTPLIVVLLSTLAATVDRLEDLPRTRAAVLINVLREVVTRWEVGTRLEGRVEVGDLSASQATVALQRGSYAFARAALMPGVSHRKALEEDLHAFLGPMSPGRVRACADDVTRFWAATGLFAFTANNVRAHPRPLAEAALAWQAIEESTGAGDLMQYRRTHAGWDVLSLIAVERVDVRSAWVHQVAVDGSVDELIAVVDAHLDGARLSDEQISQLVESAALASIRDDREPERIVEALLALDLSPELQHRLRQTVEDSLRLRDHPVIEALLLVRSPKLTRLEFDRLRTFFRADRPKSTRGEDGILHIDVLDGLHLRTLQEVALRLLSVSRADAELVASRLEKLKTRNFPTRLRRAFHVAGHDDLATKARSTPPVEPVAWENRVGDYEAATRTALSVVREIADPRPLSWTERRRLDELADLWASMCAAWWWPRWVERHTDVLRTFMRIAVVLGGFDAAAIAAEADQVISELEHDPDADDILGDNATARTLSRWDLVADCEQTAGEIIGIFGRVPHQCLPPLMKALERAPCRKYVHETLLAETPALNRIWRLQATLLALTTAPNPKCLAVTWSTDEDVRRRQAAAAALSYLLGKDASNGERVAVALLDDPDRGVQAEAVAQLASAVREGLTLISAVRDKLANLEAGPTKAYRCQWCETEVPASMTACPTCGTSAPSFKEHLDLALGRSRAPASDLAPMLRDLVPQRRIRASHDID